MLGGAPGVFPPPVKLPTMHCVPAKGCLISSFLLPPPKRRIRRELMRHPLHDTRSSLTTRAYGLQRPQALPSRHQMTEDLPRLHTPRLMEMFTGRRLKSVGVANVQLAAGPTAQLFSTGLGYRTVITHVDRERWKSSSRFLLRPVRASAYVS